MSTAGKNDIRRRQLVLFGAIGAVGGLVGAQFLRADDSSDARRVLSVLDAHQAALDKSVTLIDVRRPDEWARTGIGEGAFGIDMRRKDFIEALSDIVGPDRSVPIALICARGVRSARMARRLSEAGFTQIIDVPEGMLGSAAGPGWLALDLPVRAYDEGNG
ncbi:MAG: rhodanese-like domain-containing protein [Arenibacterium sp.]